MVERRKSNKMPLCLVCKSPIIMHRLEDFLLKITVHGKTNYSCSMYFN